MIISIEGSSNYLSLALLKNDLIISNETLKIKNELAQIIVPTIKHFLNKNSININQLSSIIVGCGPGSFTGIRTVIAAAKGIITSNNNLQTIGVSGLAGLAMSVVDEALKKNVKYIVSLIDTKRDDVFLQLFKLNDHDKLSFPFRSMNKIEVVKIEHIYKYLNKYNLSDKDILFVGHKSSSINSNIINIKTSENLCQYPNAIWVGKLALYLLNGFEKIDNTVIAFDKVEPIYVRSPEINKKI
jgi:tRNA threonylcarbamoyl adenosine modification protein YeaZ